MDHERDTSGQAPIGQATPGPWSVVSRAGYSGHKVDDAHSRSICAFPSSSKRPEAERDANARLIAAAPDMLAALRDVVSSLETLGIDGWSEAPHLMNVCRTAIAKATMTAQQTEQK